MSDFIIEKLKKEIENFSPEVKVEKIGTVISVGDGITQVDGLTDVMSSEMVIFDEDEKKSLKDSLNSSSAVIGMVLNLEENSVKVVVL